MDIPIKPFDKTNTVVYGKVCEFVKRLMVVFALSLITTIVVADYSDYDYTNLRQK